MNKVVKTFFLFIVIFIAGCWTKNYNSYQELKINDIVLSIPKGFLLTKINNNKVNKFNILYQYKQNNYSWFSDSIVIWEYVWKYPDDLKKFCSIVTDKFIRKIPGSKILNNWFNENKNIVTYWFKYSVTDNIFKESTPNYYWLQMYIFYNKKLIVLNYLSYSINNIDNFFKLVKNVKIVTN